MLVRADLLMRWRRASARHQALTGLGLFLLGAGAVQAVMALAAGSRWAGAAALALFAASAALCWRGRAWRRTAASLIRQAVEGKARDQGVQ